MPITAGRTTTIIITIVAGNARYRSDEGPGAKAPGSFISRNPAPSRSGRAVNRLALTRASQRGGEIFLALALELLLRRLKPRSPRSDLLAFSSEPLLSFRHAHRFIRLATHLSRVPRPFASSIGARLRRERRRIVMRTTAIKICERNFCTPEELNAPSEPTVAEAAWAPLSSGEATT